MLSVPVDTVRKLHKLGNGGSPRQRVYDAVAELVEAGFLSVESVRYTSNGHEWKAYQLR